MRLSTSFHHGPIFALTLVSTLTSGIHAKCYYPNGNEAKDAFPCSNEPGAMCCPFQWQCMSNGLCYNPNADIMGRYSCEDRSWDSGDCPNFCTYSDTAAGNEAILACENGRFCCNKNRQSGDCCKDDGFEFVDLAVGRVFATMNRNNQPGVPTSAPGPSLPFSDDPAPEITPPPSTTATSSSPKPSSAKPSTVLITSVVSGPETATDGSNEPSTIVVTSLIQPTAAAETDVPVGATASSKSNVGLIVGCAVGVPAVLVLAGLVAFFLWRRRKRAEDQHVSTIMDDNHGAGTAFWKPSAATKPSTDSTIHDQNEKTVPFPAIATHGSRPAGTHDNPAEIDGAEQPPSNRARPISDVSELTGSGYGRPLSNVSELAGNDYSRPRSEVEGSPGLSNHPMPFAAAAAEAAEASNPNAQRNSSGRYYSWSGPPNPSIPVTPVVGTSSIPSNSPISTSSSVEDLRSKGAHAAHYGGGGSLQPVHENHVLSGGHARSVSGPMPGGRYIPYRPPPAHQ